MTTAKTLCILGIGNVLRKDDGIASQVCSRIDELSLTGVDVRTCQQLQLEMVDELSGFDELLLVDAAAQEDAVLFEKLTDGFPAPTSFTHDLDARLFASLMKRFAGGRTSVHVCTVSGSDFGYGLEPSPQGMSNVAEAVERILEWIGKRRTGI